MNFLKPYQYVMFFILIITILSGLVFVIHKYNNYQQGIGAARVQEAWDKQIIDNKSAQRSRELQYQKEKDDAISQAAKTLQAVNAAASAAAKSSGLLSNTIQAIIARSGSDTIDADRKYTSAIAAVLNECQAAYRQLAKDADGHAGDSMMYQQAWPKETK